MLFLAVLILAAGLLALAVRHARSLEAVEEVISPVTVPGASDTPAGG
jgi:6,7-dimethyl-8-ribityllumazine synthase